MGSWGPGVFENDEAQAVVEEVVSTIRAELDAFRASDLVGIEDTRVILACMRLESLLVGAGIVVGRAQPLIEGLVEKAESIVELEGGHLSEERRQVIRQTLLEYRATIDERCR